jgi:hypothetical protein
VATIICQTMKLGHAMFAWIQHFFASPLGHRSEVVMGGGIWMNDQGDVMASIDEDHVVLLVI